MAEPDAVDVRIVALGDDRGPPGFTPRLAVLAVAVVIVAGGLAAVLDSGGRRGPRPAAPPAATVVPPARLARGAGISAAYGYPARCLAITILANAPTYARADFDRRSLCGRYSGYVTAVFHRVSGAWHVILNASDYACPVPGIPALVQTELAICPHP